MLFLRDSKENQMKRKERERQPGCACQGFSYLLRQLCVVILGGGEDEDGAEGGHVLQQGEEGAFHSVAHRLPPL